MAGIDNISLTKSIAMNIPLLPSDNLYKFIGIGSLTIFIIIAYQTIKSINTVNDIYLHLKLQEKELSLKLETTQKELDSLKPYIQGLYSQQSIDSIKPHTPRVNPAATYSLMNERLVLQNFLSSGKSYPFDNATIAAIDRIALIDKSLSISTMIAKQDSIYKNHLILHAQLDLTDELRKWNLKRNSILMSISFLASFIGFFLWYHKKQKYDDIQTKFESKRNSSDENSPPSPSLATADEAPRKKT